MKKEMAGLRDHIKERHGVFMEKMGGKANILLSQNLLDYEVTLAKIRYIATILKDEGVIDVFGENHIYAMDKFYPCSLTLGMNFPSPSITILNGAKELVVISGIVRKDILSQAFHVSMDGSEQCVSFGGVQDESFDWSNFTDKLLDFIHNIFYRKRQLIESLI